MCKSVDNPVGYYFFLSAEAISASRFIHLPPFIHAMPMMTNGMLKGFLYLFRVLDEESGGEDVSEAQTEEIAGSYACWMFAVDAPSDEEE